MKDKWQKLASAFNNKPNRERVILACMILSVMYFLSEVIFLKPQTTQREQLELRFDAVKLDLKKLSAEEKVFTKALSSDPNAAKRREIAQLEEKIIALDESLEKLSVGLIAANKLPRVLHDVIRSKGNLSLLGMQTKRPHKLQFSKAPLDGAKTEKDSIEEMIVNPEEIASVYRHSVLVELEGKYFDFIDYLEGLEALPWKLYWEALEYRVERYPSAKVLLEVYTLSTEQGVMGVEI